MFNRWMCKFRNIFFVLLLPLKYTFIFLTSRLHIEHSSLNVFGKKKGGSIKEPPFVKIRLVVVRLPSVVSKSLVGFGHLMYIFALLVCGTCVIVSIQKFCRKSVGHSVTASVSGCFDNPAHSQSFAT